MVLSRQDFSHSIATNDVILQIGGVDDIDFDLCERAARILAQIEVRSLPVKLYSLIDNVMGALCDALKNKLPSKQRQQTLKLLTSLVQSRLVILPCIKLLNIQIIYSKKSLLVTHPYIGKSIERVL